MNSVPVAAIPGILASLLVVVTTFTVGESFTFRRWPAQCTNTLPECRATM
jgi:hypothetical protein